MSTDERIILVGDMAFRAGIAIGSTTRGLLASTVIDVSAKRKNVSLARALKHMAIQIRLFALRHCESIDMLAYEEPTANPKSSNRLPQYAMVSALLWASDDLACTEVARYWPTSIKKRATGSGKAEKEAMIAVAQRFCGREVLDHNEADALVLLQLVLEDQVNPAPIQEVLF